MRSILSATVTTFLLGYSSADLATEPQRPLAAGTYLQLAKVMVAADACGFKAFRTSVEDSGRRILFLDDDGGSFACIEQWLARHARKLELSPRFDGDDYSR